MDGFSNICLPCMHSLYTLSLCIPRILCQEVATRTRGGVVTTPQPINTWLNRPKPGSEARLRLFCFPYAGGGASLYRSWAEPLASVAEILSVQLPGRENRLGERLYR